MLQPFIVHGEALNHVFLQAFGRSTPEICGDAYLAQVGKTVGKLQWSVTSECRIGIFSFLKINMYRDLKDNANKILENGNVRALLGEPLDTLDTLETGNTISSDLLLKKALVNYTGYLRLCGMYRTLNGSCRNSNLGGTRI